MASRDPEDPRNIVANRGPKGQGTPKPITIDGFVLHRLWQGLLDDWLGLASQYFSVREAETTDLNLERTIRFEDPFPGILVVRTQPRFEEVLHQALEKHSPGVSEGRDLFTESVVRFWQRLALRTHGQNGRFLRPAHFKVSAPSDWPVREPEASCFAFVSRCPLEIRFWAGLKTD